MIDEIKKLFTIDIEDRPSRHIPPHGALVEVIYRDGDISFARQWALSTGERDTAGMLVIIIRTVVCPSPVDDVFIYRDNIGRSAVVWREAKHRKWRR